MKRIRVKEIWINNKSSRDSGINGTYYPQWEHLMDSYIFDCVTIYIKTIVAE